MTREEVHEVAAAGGKAAAREMLIQMGADPDKPIEMQADFMMLRRLRIMAEKSTVAAMVAVIGVAVTAMWGWIASQRH